MRRHVWVIEIKCADGSWDTYPMCAPYLDEAEKRLDDVRRKITDRECRLTKYEAVR